MARQLEDSMEVRQCRCLVRGDGRQSVPVWAERHNVGQRSDAGRVCLVGDIPELRRGSGFQRLDDLDASGSIDESQTALDAQTTLMDSTQLTAMIFLVRRRFVTLSLD
jgi:hypothetical protein